MQPLWFVRLPHLALAVATTLTMTGCADSTPDKGAAGAASEDPQALAEDPCAVLTTGQVEDLVGAGLSGEQTTVPGSTMRACQYGSLSNLGVQVVKAPADEWAQSLPGITEALAKNGTLQNGPMKQQLDRAAAEIEKGKDLPPGKACEYFSDLVELQGHPADVNRITAYLPTVEDPLAMSAQACHDDAYVSVVVARPDITEGSSLEGQLDSLLVELAGIPQ